MIGMIILLFANILLVAPEMIQGKQWRELMVVSFITVLGISASLALMLGFKPDFYGFLKTLFLGIKT